MPKQYRLMASSGLAALIAAAVLIATTTMSQERTPQLARLGKVDFKVECNAAGQQAFNRAMALYHSFAWKPAGDTFAAVAKADPTCGMAHWGRAMVLLDNPFLWPGSLPPAKLNEIAAALDAARSTGLKSEREKGYVEAIATFVRDHEKVDHRTRVNAYDAAMAKLAARFPNDKESTIRIFGIAVTDPIEVTDFAPPHRFAIRHEGTFTGSGGITLEAGADGTTTIVRWSETLIPPVFRHLGARLQAPVLGAIFQADLERLRDIVEAGADARVAGAIAGPKG